ncbi:MAG: 2OG-Fe(II) oxygenase [Bdellovibrionaceae bacterium]|nr:2OG-Fe(II) oxygenase [Pseudobdellovibrionaceae bacterium]
MSPSLNWPHFCHKLSDDRLKEILGQIDESGFYICDAFLDTESVIHWKQFIERHNDDRPFRDSTIGKKGHEVKNANIRSDKILWIHDFSGETQGIGDWLTELSAELKNYFRLPIDDIEAHFAIYPAGARYEKHIDNGTGLNNRLFTFIFYLNPNWKPGDGGELVIYDPNHSEQEICRVQPRGGTFVLFRSDLFHHEVLQAQVPRYSFTGWLRRHARI